MDIFTCRPCRGRRCLPSREAVRSADRLEKIRTSNAQRPALHGKKVIKVSRSHSTSLRAGSDRRFSNEACFGETLRQLSRRDAHSSSLQGKLCVTQNRLAREDDVFFRPDVDLPAMRTTEPVVLDLGRGPQFLFDRLTGGSEFGGGRTSHQNSFNDRSGFRFRRCRCHKKLHK
jgi:hypothetical protein